MISLRDVIDANGLDATMDEAFGEGAWKRTDSNFLDSVSLPLSEQREKLAVLKARLWPDKEAA